MDLDSSQTRIEELEKKIADLPMGSLSHKKINGKFYFYHRWYEGQKRKERYVSKKEADALQKQIDLRKTLEKELKTLRKAMPSNRNPSFAATHRFSTNVLLGQELRDYSLSVRDYKKRECYQALHDFVFGAASEKVLILYGLRRTGKTTLIRQIIADMSDEDLSLAAFIQIGAKNTLADVNGDLGYLKNNGYRYVFLDEVTLLDDFIEGAALFSDIFAACGMKLVLSGTDSLGFLFSEDEQLYDRCVLLHTTFIPYREFERVLGIRGIDEYIRYGGTMSLGGVHYNEASTFADRKSADAYVDTAIARNIQHSLRHYQHEGHFRSLHELYMKDELTSAINRVVEDMNHRFTLEVLTREFHSHDFGISANNMRRDKNHPSDILDKVDVVSITKRLMRLLEIRNKQEQTVRLEETHCVEIREYLRLLDLTEEIPVVSLPSLSRSAIRTVIAQPGLRYAQARALIESLLLDETLSDLSLMERSFITERILNEIRGRMLEDIVLLESKISNPKKEVFVLQFPVGEFDMVIFDPVSSSCKIYEIKHSERVISEQTRHLLDEDKCAETEHRYGNIKERTVLYLGKSQTVGKIRYLNVEEYLKSL